MPSERCVPASVGRAVTDQKGAAMSITNLNPYLNFNGEAEQAIKLYEKALGAKADNVMRWRDMPDAKVATEHQNRVMHAVLHVGGGDLMVSDTLPDRPVEPGDNAHINLSFDDVTEMKRKFDALADGGEVTMPLQDTFWGAKFGMLTDAFGVQWMFNCQQQQGQQRQQGEQAQSRQPGQAGRQQQTPGSQRSAGGNGGGRGSGDRK
jgi:PhnB protein